MRPSIIERAFEIARLGRALKVDEIRTQLCQEGYGQVDLHIRGRTLLAQLRGLLKAARAG